MSRWLVLLCLLSAVHSRLCPEHCTCYVSDLLTYSCGHLTVRARDDGYMEVDCGGGPWQCDLIPTLSLGHARLKRLEVTACGAPANRTDDEGWLCALQAAGAESAQSLAVRRPRAPLTPRMLHGINATVLFLDETFGVQMAIPVGAISSAPSLRVVRLVSLSSPSITAATFASWPAVQRLELSLCGVRQLPARVFRALPHLEVLSLFKNRITVLDVDAFEGLSSLQELSLSSNPLTSLPARALRHAPRLRRLTLLDVALATVHNDTFAGLPDLQEVKLQNGSPLTLSPLAFSNSPSLASLSLPSSHVSSLPAQVFLNSTNIVNLTLSYNAISEVPLQVFTNLTKLERLDLSWNRIAVISRDMFKNLRSLVELNLDRNRIEVLPERILSGLQVRSVTLSHNRIAHISWAAFVGAQSIVTLMLGDNRLRGWGGDGDADTSSPFNMLSNLQVLSLRNNSVGAVSSDWRFVLMSLRTLDLSYNAFTQLTVTALQFIPRDNWTVTVDFRHNNISTVSPYYLYPASAAPAFPAALFVLDHNPFHCECNLYYFIKNLPNNKQYDVLNAQCESPPALRHRKLNSLHVADISCPADNVTAECDCRIRPADMNIECDCANLTSLPDPVENKVDSVSLRLRSLPDNFDRLPEYVRRLDLSNLDLDSLPKIPETVQFVDITRNKIQKVPLDLFNGNMTMKLSGNPLTCDCWTMSDLMVVNDNSKYIQDYINMTCEPYAKLSNIDPYSLCSVYRSAVAGVLFAVVLIFCAVLVAALYYYRIELQVYMYSKNIGLWLLPRETQDFDKVYDVFVSFASEDEKFVSEEILPKLEGKYLLHVQDRDWQAGDTIPTQIRESIEMSSRTIVILTKNFLKSVWASEELKLLHSHAANDKKVRAIVVLTDRLELDKDVKTYLSLATKIKWKDRMFWNKVIYALPRKDMYKSLIGRNQIIGQMDQRGGKNHYIGDKNLVVGKNGSSGTGKGLVPMWKGESLDVVVIGNGKLVNNAFEK